jgi:hypothetical protein
MKRILRNENYVCNKNIEQQTKMLDWEGDPPRTLKIENAQTFKSENEAEDRILQVRKTHPFKEMSYEVMKASNFY